MIALDSTGNRFYTISKWSNHVKHYKYRSQTTAIMKQLIFLLAVLLSVDASAPTVQCNQNWNAIATYSFGSNPQQGDGGIVCVLNTGQTSPAMAFYGEGHVNGSAIRFLGYATQSGSSLAGSAISFGNTNETVFPAMANLTFTNGTTSYLVGCSTCANPMIWQKVPNVVMTPLPPLTTCNPYPTYTFVTSDTLNTGIRCVFLDPTHTKILAYFGPGNYHGAIYNLIATTNSLGIGSADRGFPGENSTPHPFTSMKITVASNGTIVVNDGSNNFIEKYVPNWMPK